MNPNLLVQRRLYTVSVDLGGDVRGSVQAKYIGCYRQGYKFQQPEVAPFFLTPEQVERDVQETETAPAKKNPPALTMKEKWKRVVSEHLVGRKIVGISWMTEAEADKCGWTDKAVVLELDDGNLLWPSADDEGNGAGAIFTTIDSLPTIPVMR